MTTLKTPEELRDSFSFIDKLNGKEIVEIENKTEERDQAIATLLCKLLEKKKLPVHERDWDQANLDEGFNNGLKKAQAIIRQTLEGKQG